MAVAMPYCASVRDPVVPVPARYIVSVVMAIVQLPAFILINVNTVPIGKATLLPPEFAGIVNVPADDA